MKKNLFLILGSLILCLSSCLHANVWDCSPPADLIVEFRMSYFRPSSSEFRELFPHGGVNYQLTSSLPIYEGADAWARGINLWSGIDYFSKEGHSIGLDTKTNIRIVPLTLGLKYFLPGIGPHLPINFYVAGGMKYYFVHTYNDSDTVQKTVNRNGLGGVVETGFITTFDCFIVDLFVSYSFKSFGAPSIANPAVEATGLDVSGVNVGAGLGYRF